MKKIQHVETLTIPLGQTTVSKTFTLPTGFVARVVAYTNGIEDNTKEMIQLALVDSNSVEIIPAVNIKNWKQNGGGNYLESMKPLGIETLGRDYKLVLSTDRNLAQNPPVAILVKVQVAFIYQDKK